ncbi:CsxC family protein [Virgibacillus flavescens]|uniref:CsxC family protein n=1 Tax=Virgibacillus flavescens TaxID=1611422 RepID=UPI003D32BC6B
MKKNTRCGNGHNGCPSLPATNKAKSRSMPSEFFVFSGGEEETVILGDVFIQSLTEADFYLPTYAREIKHIKKNVSLTQCHAQPDIFEDNVVKLFVEGIVHKNIQYVEGSFGEVKDFSIDIPFQAYDRITLTSDVEAPLGFPFSVKDNVVQRRQLAEDGMGADRCQFGSLTFEFNNEPINCKLLASAVNQWDITKNFDNWGRFNKVTEKMDIVLAVRLTQKQSANAVVPETNTNDIYNKIKKITRQ